MIPLAKFALAIYSSTVPTSPPQNTNGAAATSTSIILHWSPPPIEGQNGDIVMYRVSITEVESGSLIQYTTNKLVLSVPALHPFYTYEWVVSAATIIGYGPYTEMSTVKTLEDSK